MKSRTFFHGRQGVLWLEVDQHGRVVIQSEGLLSAVARAGLLEDALNDLAAQSKIPVSILRALIVRTSTSWPRRLLAGILSKLVAGRRELAPSTRDLDSGEPPPLFNPHVRTRNCPRSPALGDSGTDYFSGYTKKRGNQ